jgi:hypothetical protein
VVTNESYSCMKPCIMPLWVDIHLRFGSQHGNWFVTSLLQYTITIRHERYLHFVTLNLMGKQCLYFVILCYSCSTPLCRLKLHVKPPMPYRTWTKKLELKVSYWYKMYIKSDKNANFVSRVR